MTDFTICVDDPMMEDRWDVIVAGGGPAGCAAAAAAARDGARTLLIESTGSLGGMGTSGLVTCWAPFSDKQGNLLYGGLAKHLFCATKKAMPHIPEDQLDWVAFNPEHLKLLYDRTMKEHGASVLFHTLVVDVQTDADGRIRAIIAAGKGGWKAFSAGVYIDATGDGDLAARAGAPFQQGDEASGELQPASLCFLMAGVNTDVLRAGPGLGPGNPDSPVYHLVDSDHYPNIRDPHCASGVLAPGLVTFNAGHVWEVDGTDPESVSRGMMVGREIARQFLDGLRETYPEAFGEAVLAATAPSMGIRETRRIKGRYTLCLEDYMARRKFDDDIAQTNYWIDIHTSKEEIQTSRNGNTNVTERYESYGPGESLGIPYRCLVPEKCENLLVAGRCISCDRPVQGSIRVQPVCLVTGEAAGTAAAICARESIGPAAVDPDDLRTRLIQTGARLPQKS
jgi:hypothetical protein